LSGKVDSWNLKSDRRHDLRECLWSDLSWFLVSDSGISILDPMLSTIWWNMAQPMALEGDVLSRSPEGFRLLSPLNLF
jgi:hypothetical protein